jgi:uncharacterized surface protein with fasciclin (FAS1) repeats
MTSVFYNDPIWDFRIAYEIKDLEKTPINEFIPNPQSISGEIFNNENFSIFKFLLKKSQLIKDYSDPQSNYTLFATPDNLIRQNYNSNFNENTFVNMDKYTARMVILYNTLPGKLPFEALASSPIAYLTTKTNGTNFDEKLFFKIYDGVPTLNNISNIIEGNAAICNNGVIHITDKIVFPKPIQGIMMDK